MRCPDCGSEISQEMSFCARCGRQLKDAPFVSSHRMMGGARASERAGKDRNAILIVIALIVAIIVVPMILSAVLYFMVLGFDSEKSPPTGYMTKTPISNGYRFTIMNVSQDTSWGDTAIYLSDGQSIAEWFPDTSSLQGDGLVMVSYAAEVIGEGILVSLTITDVAGNGLLDSGDSFTLTTSFGLWAAGAAYTVQILYQPLSSLICSSTFVG